MVPGVARQRTGKRIIVHGEKAMDAIISRCGFRCDLCPAFVKNSPEAADRQIASAAWSKYFRLRVKPESMRCYGCLAKKGRGFDFPPDNCSVRDCVLGRGLENCAGCSEYPCKTMEKRMKGVEKTLRRYTGNVPKGEYNRFLAPYDARSNLKRVALRKSSTARRARG